MFFSLAVITCNRNKLVTNIRLQSTNVSVTIHKSIWQNFSRDKSSTKLLFYLIIAKSMEFF